MLVMGTSLRVAPVSEILPQLPPTIPVVLINRELVGQPHSFDVELLGDSDIVVEHLRKMLDVDENIENESCERTCLNGGPIEITTCNDPSQAADAVALGRIVRWLPRPSTYLFRGFALPPTSCPDDSSSGISEEGYGDEELDEHGTVDEANGMSLNGGAMYHHLLCDRDKNSSPVSPGPGSLKNFLDVCDPTGPCDYAVAAESNSSQKENGTEMNEASVQVKPAENAGGRWGEGHEESCCLDAWRTRGHDESQAAEHSSTPSSPTEARRDGYDESWGIQRPRPRVSIMASMGRK